jgi:type I restriction enzyme S subunit
MSAWQSVKLGSLGELMGGVTSISRSDYGYGTPFIPYKNIYQNAKVDITQLVLMNINQKDLERRKCIYGDVFFTASSETPDEVAMSSVLLDDVDDLTFNGFSKRFRLYDFKTLLPEFARYYFRSPYFRACIYERMTGDIRYNISNGGLNGVLLYLPPIEEQSRIADILSAYDDAIENNNRRIALLEQAARELYREWFVRMRFPGHETAKFVNGLPEGWEVVPFGALAEIIDGDRGVNYPKQDEFFEEGYCLFLNAGNVTKDGFAFNNNAFITEEKDKKLRKGKLSRGDIVLTTRGTVGNVAFYSDYIPYAVVRINSGMVILRDSGEVPAEFLYITLRADAVQKMIELYSSGSAQPQLPIKDMRKMKILKPRAELLKAFSKIAGNMLSESALLQSKSQNLACQRDMLLPRLMNGKLEV